MRIQHLIVALGAAGALAGCGLGGGSSPVTRLVTEGLDRPRQIAVTAVGDRIYWTDPGLDVVMRAELDGSNAEAILSGLHTPTGLAIRNDTLYFAELTGNSPYGTLSKAQLDGSAVTLLVDQIDSPNSIAVDATGSTAYWVEQGIVFGDQAIKRSGIGGAPVDATTAEVIEPDSGKDIWLDHSGTNLYYTVDGSTSVPTALHRLSVSGGTTNDTLAEGAPTYDAVTTDPTDTTVFWGEGEIHTSSRVVRYEAGDTTDLLRGEIEYPQDLAYNPADDMLYGIDYDVTGPSIFRIPAR